MARPRFLSALINRIRSSAASLDTGQEHLWRSFGEWGGIPGVWGRYNTTAGEIINERSALLVSTHFACIRCKSEDIGKLPIIIAERDGDRERILRSDHPAFRLLNEQYNPEMDAMTGTTTLLAHAIGFRKGVAEIRRNPLGEPVELWPLDPTRVHKTRRKDTNEIIHVFWDETNSPRVIPDENILEIIGPSYDGRIGYSMAELTKYTLGAVMAAQKFQGSFFGNGAWLGGIIDELPKSMDPRQLEILRQSFNERHQGAHKAFGVGIIPGGGKFKEIGVDPHRGQLRELLDWSVVDICRFHRVPPHKVQDRSEAHYNSIEHAEIEYVSDALMPIGRTLELQIKRKLLSGSLYARLNYNALLRADFKTRLEGYAIGRMWGIYTINEIRKKEDEDAIDDRYGDMRLIPANMIPIERAFDSRDAQSTQSESPSQKPDPASVKSAFLPLVMDGIKRAAAKEEKVMQRLRRKGAGHEGEINEFYETHKTFVLQNVIPVLGAIARIVGGAEANAERLEMFGKSIAEQYANERPGSDGTVSDEWIVGKANKWIDMTIFMIAKEDPC